MAQPKNPSTPRSKAQHLSPGSGNRPRVCIRHPSHRIALVLLLGHLFSPLPSAAQGTTPAPAQTLLQSVQLDQTGAGHEGAGRPGLGQQPRADWLTGLVEFFSAVPPECRAVPNQHPHKECEQRERGVLERLKESHPVAFNLVVAGLTLIAGFIVGGGLQGGR